MTTPEGTSGGAPEPAGLEQHFARSSFVREVACVAWDASSRRCRLVAVPDRAALLANGLTGVRELLRFEFETLAVQHDPPLAFPDVAITFDPLPRRDDGEVDRVALAGMAGTHLVLHTRSALPASAGAARVLGAIAAVAPEGTRPPEIDADTNLELDLGFDSLARAALWAEVELRMGLAPAASGVAWHEVFTVGDLLRCVAAGPTGPVTWPTPAAGPVAWPLPAADPVTSPTPAADPVAWPMPVAGSGPDVWEVLLADARSSDPGQDALVHRTPLWAAFFWCILRLARLAVWPWLRIEVVGRSHLPARGAALLCPNHESLIDAFVVSAALPYRILRQVFYLGATEYFATPLMAAVARIINLVPVDADRNLARAMRMAAFGLRRGKILVVFPEGERSIDGTVRTFRAGAARLAQATRSPLVPVATRGLFALWPRGHRPRWRTLRPWRPARVRVVIGPPIAPDPDRSVEDTTRVLRDTVLSLWASATDKQAGSGDTNVGTDPAK